VRPATTTLQGSPEVVLRVGSAEVESLINNHDVALDRRLIALEAWFADRVVEHAPSVYGAILSPLPRPRTPTTIDRARAACSRVAAGLVRDYHLRGTTIRADAASVNVMQMHLRTQFPHGLPEDDEGLWEVRRHGAVLAEIFAHAFGAVWLDVADSDIALWTMTVAPGHTTCPFGCVDGYLALRNGGSDLVAHYLQLAEHSLG
jgi:hypothetical protein